MSVTNPMKPLLQRLSKIGYTENYVRRKVLPDWWEDCIAQSPAGYQQAIMLLSRNLRLELHSLREEELPVRCREFNQTKYKLKPSDTPDTVRIATCIAFRAAQLACHAMQEPPVILPSSATDIRRSILGSGAAGIGFERLLEYCWGVGIPVLHISEFPSGAHKPHALAVIIDERPAIVLCKNTEYSAWLLFHLAHELGHIVLGHLQGTDILIDAVEEVQRDADTEETEANQFALELLTGFQQRSYNYGNVNTEQLARVAQAVGRDAEVDAGFIALSHGRMTGHWAAANGAIKIIESSPNALEIVRRQIRQHIDRDRLSRDSEDFFMRITGVDSTE